MVDATKELEMIRREGFEQREGERTRYSGDYGGAPPRSRGYLGRGYHPQSSRPIHAAIPASELVTLALRARCILRRVHPLNL